MMYSNFANEFTIIIYKCYNINDIGHWLTAGSIAFANLKKKGIKVIISLE